jgi:alanyl-tRNA synthetase
MSTEKLYWGDPFASQFEAERAVVATYDGRPSIVLERTLFYPEAGGQLADTGTLAVGTDILSVSDVQVDDAGVIHHLLTMPPPAELSGTVRGAIDAARRRDHMAQHTAQHMLSRALLDVGKAETVSARLGATSCTIDVDVPGMADATLARAEDLVNAIVMDDVEVRQHFPTASELAAMPLRRTPKVTTSIRVIEVAGFDFTPCGGTHATRTGQIGAIVVAGVEKYKGGLRVSFHAANRAREDARKKERVLAELARDFTCGLLDVGAAVTKLRGELKTRTELLSGARGELVGLLSDAALAAHPPRVGEVARIVVVRQHDDVAALRTLAGRLTTRDDVLALVASKDAESGDWAVVVQRGAKVTIDCGAWLKAAAAKHGGRGGGRPERAEGRLSGGTPFETLAAS